MTPALANDFALPTLSLFFFVFFFFFFLSLYSVCERCALRKSENLKEIYKKKKNENGKEVVFTDKI